MNPYEDDIPEGVTPDGRPNFNKESHAGSPTITVAEGGVEKQVPFSADKTFSYYLKEAGIKTGFLGTGIGSGKMISATTEAGITTRVKMSDKVNSNVTTITVNTKVRNG